MTLRSRISAIAVGCFSVLPFCAEAQFSLYSISSASVSTDTICAGIPIQFTDLSFCPDGPMAVWEYSFGNGDVSNVQNPLYTFPTSGTYTVSLSATDGFNCGNIGYSRTIVVLDPPSVVPLASTGVSCNGDCDGTATASIIGQLAVSEYIIDWTGPTTGAGTTATNLCPGSYGITVTDQYACKQNIGTFTQVSGSPAVTAFISYPQAPVGCDGDQLQLNASAIGGNPASNSYSFQWTQSSAGNSFDDDTSPNPIYNLTQNNTGDIYLLATDDYGCISATAVDAVGHSTTTIQGTVTVDGLPCNSCPIFIYMWNTFDAWSPMADQQVISNPDGSYSFVVPAYHEFIVKVVPDTSIYPTTCPTYSGDVHDFLLADMLSSDCGLIITEDIAVITMPVNAGSCTLTGGVYGFLPFVPGKVNEEDPIPLIDVVVEKVPPGGSFIMAHDITALDGTYSFNFMPESNGAEYIIHVDITGIPQVQTYNITVNPGDVLFSNLDFCVTNDPNLFPDMEIITCNIVEIGHVVENAGPLALTVSPNPTAGIVQCTVAGFNAKLPAVATVYDATGRVSLSMQIRSAKADLDLSNLAPGVYSVRVTQDGQTAHVRVVVQ